jgi:hypothetical protein
MEGAVALGRYAWLRTRAEIWFYAFYATLFTAAPAMLRQWCAVRSGAAAAGDIWDEALLSALSP